MENFVELQVCDIDDNELNYMIKEMIMMIIMHDECILNDDYDSDLCSAPSEDTQVKPHDCNGVLPKNLLHRVFNCPKLSLFVNIYPTS